MKLRTAAGAGSTAVSRNVYASCQTANTTSGNKSRAVRRDLIARSGHASGLVRAAMATVHLASSTRSRELHLFTPSEEASFDELEDHLLQEQHQDEEDRDPRQQARHREQLVLDPHDEADADVRREHLGEYRHLPRDREAVTHAG